MPAFETMGESPSRQRYSMRILYDDSQVRHPGESFRLIFLQNGWHVVAKGYLCRVTNQEEGRRLIDSLIAHKRSVEQRPLPDTH